MFFAAIRTKTGLNRSPVCSCMITLTFFTPCLKVKCITDCSWTSTSLIYICSDSIKVGKNTNVCSPHTLAQTRLQNNLNANCQYRTMSVSDVTPVRPPGTSLCFSDHIVKQNADTVNSTTFKLPIHVKRISELFKVIRQAISVGGKLQPRKKNHV